MKQILAFDSGVGGLLALGPLLKNYRGLSIFYLGDLANLPYGTKSPKLIVDLSSKNCVELTALFKKENPQSRPELFIVACNTASAHALGRIEVELNQIEKIPVVGVVLPTCKHVFEEAQKKEIKRIVILATPATVASEIYPAELKKLGFAGEITQIATPLFVPLVEEGLESSPSADHKIELYLKGKIHPSDGVILGCTHYPLLIPKLKNHFPKTIFFDSGTALLSLPFWKNTGSERNKLKVFLTDSTRSQKDIESLLKKIGIEPKSIDLELTSIDPVVNPSL